MSQEMNKKAVADLFSIEDARAVCEAIGGLGLNQKDEATDEPLDYTPDNILDVTVNENPDGMPAFPQLGQEEMDGETQAFVVDELAKQLQADGRESLSDEDLIPFAVKIKGENNISQDLVSFIEQLTSNADTRLATQNTSEAQPNGVATDLSNGSEGTPSPDVVEPVSDVGALPPEAPGGLAEPTETPALNTNPDESFNLNVPAESPAAEGDFNIDVPEPGTEVSPEGGDDSFNLDIGDESDETSADDNMETIGELDFGDEGDKESTEEKNGESEEDDLFSALDGMSDEALDDGAESDETKSDAESSETEDKNESEDKPAETEANADDTMPVIDEPVEPSEEGLMPAGECGEVPPTAVECGDAPMTQDGEAVLPSVNEGIEEADASMSNEDDRVPPPVNEDADGTEGAEESEVDSADMDGIDAQLESIKANYVESLARERVRAVVESYEEKRALAEKQALCESIIADYNARKTADERQAKVESALGDKIAELGDKVSALCESNDAYDALNAKFESIIGKFKEEKAANAASTALDAKLESILAKAKNDKEVDAKLAAIVESVKSPKTVDSKQDSAAIKRGLDAKLESIIADAKQKIAAAK